MSIAKVIVAGREVGPDPDRFQAVRQPLVRIAAIDQALTKIGASLCAVGIEGDGIAECRQGFVVFCLLSEHRPQVVPRHGKLGTNAKRSKPVRGFVKPTERL